MVTAHIFKWYGWELKWNGWHIHILIFKNKNKTKNNCTLLFKPLCTHTKCTHTVVISNWVSSQLFGFQFPTISSQNTATPDKIHCLTLLPTLLLQINQDLKLKRCTVLLHWKQWRSSQHCSNLACFSLAKLEYNGWYTSIPICCANKQKKDCGIHMLVYLFWKWNNKKRGRKNLWSRRTAVNLGTEQSYLLLAQYTAVKWQSYLAYTSKYENSVVLIWVTVSKPFIRTSTRQKDGHHVKYHFC